MNGVVFVEERPMEGREIEATSGIVIGREGTDVVLDDPEVSRRHAAVREHGGGVAIEDLGSTNGTFVNDRRISGLEPLSDGDTVRFGSTVWRLRAPVADAPAGATQIVQRPPMPPEPAQPQPAAPPTPEPVAPPQVTAAQSLPADVQATSAGAAAPPTPPAAPQAPAEPGAPSPQAVGPRGDVPAPPDVAPSAIRRVLPPPGAGQAAAFSPPGQRNITSKTGSAATRVEATVVCLLFALAVAIALVVYFAAQ